MPSKRNCFRRNRFAPTAYKFRLGCRKEGVKGHGPILAHHPSDPSNTKTRRREEKEQAFVDQRLPITSREVNHVDVTASMTGSAVFNASTQAGPLVRENSVSILGERKHQDIVIDGERTGVCSECARP